MRTCLECVPCFFRQALEAARLAGADETGKKEVLDKVALSVPAFPLHSSPPEMARIIHGIVREVTGVEDPYERIKEQSNEIALRLYPELKKRTRSSPESLFTATLLAIAGNIIDYGVKNSVDVERELGELLNGEGTLFAAESSAMCDYPAFEKALEKAGTVLFLADNAGEVVFDRVLIEEIEHKVGKKRFTYAVRSRPAINDALERDARFAGLDKIARVLPSGVDAPGTILSLCSSDFLRVFEQADMVISKGQGNFEALSDTDREVFFLFTAKCPVAARAAGCDVGDAVLSVRRGAPDVSCTSTDG